MKFKDMRLGMKLASGFGALIFITCVLGAQSFFSMRSGYTGSEKLTGTYLPEVGVGLDIQRSALQTMRPPATSPVRDVRGLGRKSSSAETICAGHLKRARQLSEEHVVLAT